MKLDQLTKRYPVIASIAVVVIIIVLTEAPIQSIRNTLTPVTGRFYGDYLTDLALNALGVVMLLVAAKKVGLGGQLGLNKPHSWASLLLTWPLVLMSVLNGSEYLFGNINMVFDPILFIILTLLYVAVGFFEELLLRGYVQGFLMHRWSSSRREILLSILLTSLIFCGAHLTNLVMGRSTPLHAAAQVIYTFFFGVFFSALYIRSGSLFPGILLHTIVNFAGNLSAFVPGAQPRSASVQSTTIEGFFISVLITLPLLLIGLFYLRKSKLRIPT